MRYCHHAWLAARIASALLLRAFSSLQPKRPL
jgi:hypothetical protein